ncbi:54S ribosomal protein L38, mitochondrial, partial [Massospora cicadina]
MIQLKSCLNVIDNSGALVAECIKCLRGASVASLGDEIVVTIKKAKPIDINLRLNSAQNKIKKGDVRRAVIVRVKKEVLRQDGRYIRFDDNACVLLNNAKQPIGTRVLGLVAKEVREKNWLKVVSLAPK